jgi:hypothetical protein
MAGDDARLPKADDDHTSRLIGRAGEIRWFTRWFDEGPSPTRYVFVTGPPGIGKTTLIDAVYAMAQERAMRRVWLDGRLLPQTPLAALRFWRSWIREQWGTADLSGLAGPSVVTVDNYEHVVALDNWLARYLVDVIPPHGVLWVVASRLPPGADWVREATAERVKTMPLGPFSREEVGEYLAVNRLEDASEVAWQITGGLPLALKLWTDYRDDTPLGERRAWGIARTLGERIWAGLADEGDRRGLLALLVVPSADEELLGAITGKSWEALRPALMETGVVEAGPNGLMVHDLFRHPLANDARRRWPDQFLEVETKVSDRLARRVQRSQGAPRRLWVGHLIEVIRHRLPRDTDYADLTARSYHLTPAMEADLPWMHASIERWTLQPVPVRDVGDLHRLLDDWFARQATTIQVHRDEADRPIGFFAPFLVSDETLPVIEPYTGPIAEWLQEPRAGLAVRPVAAHTFFGGLVGVDPSLQGAARSAVIGAISRDALLLRGSGMRVILLATSVPFSVMLANLGFHPRSTGLQDPKGGTFYELDLRQRDFAEWVLETAYGVSPPMPRRVEVSALRDALEHWHDLGFLHDSTLAHRKGWSGERVQERLLWIVTTDTPPWPVTKEDQAILRLFYGERHITVERMAQEQALSRATLYRRIARALAAVASALSTEA